MNPTPDADRSVPRPDLEARCVETIRMLAVDAVEKAGSGHPGTPMGCAEIAFHLWTRVMRYDPEDPGWPDRDRFVLSAGHASMLLYAMLHLTGYRLTLEDLASFRQWGASTPGHPEYRETPGVELTTGPLGQGFAHGVGMALAARMLDARFGGDGFRPVRQRVFGICSDGDLMEGVAHESASLAGHLGLGNLVYVYDDNRITIDGPTRLAFSEDVEGRFRACGWHTARIDGHDLAQIARAFDEALSVDDRPSLILARTHIAKGAPHAQDTSKAHGAPLGREEVAATKKAAGWPQEPTFLVPEEVRAHFAARVAEIRKAHAEWEEGMRAWRRRDPERAAEWDRHLGREVPGDLGRLLVEHAMQTRKAKEATRSSSGRILSKAAERVPTIVAGSADLEASTKIGIPEGGSVGPASEGKGADLYRGRTLHFGIREHAMGAIVNGIALQGVFRPVGATFFVFSDYLRPSIRLASLMRIPSTFVFTHDSILVGEDGPTHQPIEHLAALRAIPGLTVLRPADSLEVAAAWSHAIANDAGPVCLVLTRQSVAELDRAPGWDPQEVLRGGYVLAPAGGKECELCLVATGSEVSLAVEASAFCAREGVRCRVVSMPSVELFLAQEPEYRDRVLPPGIPRVTIELGATLGWRRIAGDGGLVLGIDRFGASAPGEVIAEKLGFTPDAVARRILEWRRGDRT